MNWEAIGAIGEVAGAVGVITTLLYLSVQIKASNLASKVQSKIAASQMYTDFLRMLIVDPDINEVMIRGRRDWESLEGQDFHRYSNMAFQSFSYFSTAHFQYSHGTLKNTDWFENYAIIQFWLRGPGCRQWWQRVGRYMFGPDFVEFIDAEIVKLESASSATEQ